MKTLVCRGCAYPTLRCASCGAECCRHFAESSGVVKNAEALVLCHPCLTDPDDGLEEFRPPAPPSEDCYP